MKFLSPPPPLPPYVFTVLLLLLPTTFGINITNILSSYPNLSAFSSLLTSISDDLSSRSSLTLLAVPNSILLHVPTPNPDVLRYHILLQYLSPSDLPKIPPSGELITTLFQSTGRAPANSGAVNLTRDPSTGTVTANNATILTVIKTLPYNVSIFSVSSLIIPSGLDISASETRPPPPMNITQVLIDGKDFNVAAAMLKASGVADEFEADERGAGITVFVPTDEAFAGVSKSLQPLPAEEKAVVLRFHVLHSYYPLGSLESIVNPVQPTLATEDSGAGRFTLNISRVNGSVAIDTGVVQASITRTVFDQNPVAVFAVSRVLLPREMFGSGGSGGLGSGAAVMAPEYPDPPEEVGFAPARLSSPPGLRGEIRSGIGGGVAAAGGGGRGFDSKVLFFFSYKFCTGLFVYLLLLV